MLSNELQNLKPSERLELVGDLWDSLTDLPEAIPFTAPQREELERRLAKHAADPHGGVPWDEVKRRILGRE